MVLLYGNLDLQESAEIVTRLEAQRIPYQIGSNGTQILVPEDRMLRVRMQLAEAGLPSGGSMGYEIFDKTNALSATNFMQNINHLRALEGELARTIRAIDQVQSARVHLVLPKREVFSRDQREPSASIIIKTKGGRLDQPQVRAIQNLVASAVPDLKPSRISVVDDRGNLLAGTQEEPDPATAAATRMEEMRRQAEERLRKNIEALLERSVGIGNVRAEVAVDMDFDRVTTNQELFDPDQQVVRSTQTITEENQSQEGQQNVTVANNLPEAQNRGRRPGDLAREPHGRAGQLRNLQDRPHPGARSRRDAPHLRRRAGQPHRAGRWPGQARLSAALAGRAAAAHRLGAQCHRLQSGARRQCRGRVDALRRAGRHSRRG
jgi:Flagellar biosynthesis/type III secretory pathway lipoprotein